MVDSPYLQILVVDDARTDCPPLREDLNAASAPAPIRDHGIGGRIFYFLWRHPFRNA